MKEAEHIAEGGSLGSDAAQTAHANAADGCPRSPDNDSASPAHGAALTPEDADRYALAFRPSWAPLAPDAAEPTGATSAAPAARSLTQESSALSAASDEQLRVPGRRMQRSLGLATVSVLSFFALVYWGIASTTNAPPPAPSVRRALPEAASPAAASVATTGPGATDPSEPLAQNAQRAQLEQRAAPPIEATELPTAAGTEPVDQAAPDPATMTASSPQQPLNDPLNDNELVGAQGLPSQQEQEQQEQQEQPAVTAQDPAPSEQPPAADTIETPSSAAEAAPAPSEEPAASAAQTPTAQQAEKAQQPAPSSVAPAAQPQSAPAAPVAPAPKSVAPKAVPPVATPLSSAQAIRPETAKPSPPQLVVRAIPEGSQLWLDGQPMSNPFETKLPLGSRHKIEARSEGYETSSQSIRLESDARLTITLRRAAPLPTPHIKVRPLSEGPRGAGFVTSNPY